MLFHKWSLKQKGEFLKQTGQCLLDGYPLHLAIEMQVYQTKPRIHAQIKSLIQYIREGEQLDRALAKCGFPGDVCQFIYFAGESGELGEGFNDGGEMLIKQAQYKESLQKVLRYPLFLLWIFGLLFSFLSRYLFPNFLQLYQGLSLKLPFITLLLLHISAHFLRYGVIFGTLLMVFILSGYLFIYRVNPLHRYRFLLRIPFLSHYLQLYLTQYLAFHLGSLIRSGLTVNQSLLIIKDRTKPLFFHLEAHDLYKQLKEGKTLAELFRTRPYYLKEFNQVLYQGELNGMLGPALFDYASRLLKRMESQLTAALNSVQPVILVIMGSLILVLFLSIMLPVFNIINGL